MKRVYVCALALVGLFSSTARAFLIDDFDSFQSVYITTAAPASQQSVLADAAVLGGWRGLYVNKTTGGTGFTNAVAAESNGDGLNTFQVSNGTHSDSTVILTWDGNGAGLGGIDITDAGAAKGVFIKLLVTDMPNASLKFDVFSSSGASSSSILVTQVVSGVNLYAPFSGFVGTANFSQITSFKLTLDGVTSWDAAFDTIHTGPAPITTTSADLPEPAPLALLGLGLALLGLSQRRRR